MKVDKKDIYDYLLHKKTIHVDVPYSTFLTVREVLQGHGSTPIQPILTEFLVRLSLEDKYAMDIVEDVKSRSRYRKARINLTGGDEIFDILEDASPLNPKNNVSEE